MNKIIWIVTHDSYIDRRIIFFAETFMKMGFVVKLFPFYYFDLLADSDPEYVCRPHMVKNICYYELEVDSLDEKIREFIATVEALQQDYYNKNHKYAKTLRAIRLHTIDKMNVAFVVKEDCYLMEINGTIYYNSMSKKAQLYLRDQPFAEVCAHEDAIYHYLQTKTLEPFTVNDINLKCMVDEYGGKHCLSQNPNNNKIYSYDIQARCLACISPLSAPSGRLDVIGGKSFDFIDLKNTIFDYSCILERIKQEMDRETPSIVYVADLPTLPIGVMLKETIGCKLMVDCHEWWYKQECLWSAQLPARAELSEKYEAELYKKCDVCITVGHYLAQDMGKRYGKEFETVYSCVSEELLDVGQDSSDAKTTVLEELNIPKGSKVAIFQGGMTTLRNLDNLARATKYLDVDSFLIVVGDGAYKEEFCSILQKEGNPLQTRMVGWVKQTDLILYTRCADLGILPYYKIDDYYSYSAPNKLMEYIGVSLPILYDGSMCEIDKVAGGNGVGVSCDLTDARVFGTEMNNLLRDSRRLDEIRESYSVCKAKYSFSSQEREIIRITEKLLGDKTCVSVLER